MEESYHGGVMADRKHRGISDGVEQMSDIRIARMITGQPHLTTFSREVVKWNFIKKT